MRDGGLAQVLEGHVASFEGEAADWNDVLRRARRQPRVSRSRLAVAVACVLVAAGALAATPAGRSVVSDTLDRFSAWVSGEPGTPAGDDHQAAFERRNRASYAAFPTDTKLRTLLETEVAGERFELLGFRTASAFCLRLVRASVPGARGENQCVPKSYLESVEDSVVIAGTGYFRVGSPEQAVDGVYGFAADDVNAVEVERERGSRAPSLVDDNAFLSLRARPSGTAATPPPQDAVARVWSLTDGRRTLVPYVAEGYGVYGRKRPRAPAYFGASVSKPEDLPGPAAVERPLGETSIGWIERREERGEAFDADSPWLDQMGDVLFSRAIQPDPDDPFRVGLVVVHAEPGGRFRRPKAETVLCLQELEPLGPRQMGGSCLQPDGVQQPIVSSGFFPTEFTRVTGLAVDGVESLTVHLSTGRRLEAALRDNVFSFRAPFAEFPAKVVARDTDGRVVGIQTLVGPHRLKPCPPASFVRKTSELPPPRPYERVDIALRTVNGQQILGKTAADVMASLGKPARIRYPSDNDRSSITELRYGAGGADFSLQVHFGKRGGSRVATFVVIRGPSTVDARLGHILRIQPARLEQRIRARLGAFYEPDFGYGSIPGRPCTGAFKARGIRRQLTIGLSPYRPSRPFVFLGWQ